MIGGFLIDIISLGLIGDCFQNSVSATALVYNEVSTASKAGSLSKVSHMTINLYIHHGQHVTCMYYSNRLKKV